jgi:membrane protein YqaA with SNARE-associated domain
MTLQAIRNKVLALVGVLGGSGLFLISFLDSSVLAFPIINDLLLMRMCYAHPRHIAYYVLMATLGSVVGCVVLYYIARKGGETFYRRRAGTRGEGVRTWIERNGFLGTLAAALLPPPTPFKLFVIAAGVLEVPLRTFALAVLLARLVRYFTIGILAVRYGEAAAQYLGAHRLAMAGIVLGIVVLSYLLSKAFVHHAPRE